MFSLFQTPYRLLPALSLLASMACVPMETVTRPTLDDVRLGRAQTRAATDTRLRPGEIRGEILQVNPARREIRVRADDGRDRILTYDINRTKVTYHGWEYTVENLEAGDLIAFQFVPRDSSAVDTIRVQEPVQARATSPHIGRPTPAPARSDVVEGTIERIQHDLGVFEVRPRTGRPVTVSVPYNARQADVESFRRLRRGDYVRVEGEFVNPDSLQLLAFLLPR